MRLGEHINGMDWRILNLGKPQNAILTSDRPVVMSNGIGNPDSFILVPMTPTHLFVAVNRHRAFEKIGELLQSQALPKLMNNAIVTQAQKFVYGQDDSQLRFVENRLSRGAKIQSQDLRWIMN
jgi:Protein of unknown function (DUF4238)